jgi:hypothetical protein
LDWIDRCDEDSSQVTCISTVNWLLMTTTEALDIIKEVGMLTDCGVVFMRFIHAPCHADTVQLQLYLGNLDNYGLTPIFELIYLPSHYYQVEKLRDIR